MVLHAELFAVVFGVEAGVVVEGLAVDGEALGAGFGDGADALASADVDEVNGAHLVLCEADGATEGDVFGQVGVDVVHVPPVPEVAFRGRGRSCT